MTQGATDDNEVPHFIRLRSIDSLVLEMPVDPKRMDREIKTPIRAGVERVYEFKSEFMSNLYFSGLSWRGKKLDEYSTVVIRLYEERKPADFLKELRKSNES